MYTKANNSSNKTIKKNIPHLRKSTFNLKTIVSHYQKKEWN